MELLLLNGNNNIIAIKTYPSAISIPWKNIFSIVIHLLYYPTN